MFGETKIAKHKFHHHRSPFFIYDVYINKILVPTKVTFH